METEHFLTQVQKALTIVAGIISIFTFAAVIYVVKNDINLHETISMRKLFPFILIATVAILMVFGYFLRKRGWLVHPLFIFYNLSFIFIFL